MRVGCIGDIHGDFDRMRLVLSQAGFVSTDGAWTAGDDKLVFIGDFTDRHPGGIKVIQDVMRLQGEAQKDGGEVVALLGNHDAMLLARAMQIKGEDVDWELPETFRFNGGYAKEVLSVVYVEELQNWLRCLPAVRKIGTTLFQHVDSAQFYLNRCKGDVSVEGINARVREMMSSGAGAFDVFCAMCDHREWDMSGMRNHAEVVASVERYLSALGAERVVHGHTGHNGCEPLIYMDGRVVNVDGFMSLGYRKDEGRGFVWFDDMV